MPPDALNLRLLQSHAVGPAHAAAARPARTLAAPRIGAGDTRVGAVGKATGDRREDREGEFTAFYEQHVQRIVRTVALVVRDGALAEDAVAEAFARAWARWRQVRTHDRPAAWVTRVALNECNSRFRRRRVERRKAHAVARPDQVQDPEPHASHVWAAVARLTEQERTLVALRYIADLPQAQIAELLGVPPGTVASGLNRSRRRLGIDLRPDADEEVW
jgi:RNA polymerase sigma-70 factor, ECF subfamily